jgi:hypothetical protein
VRVVAGPHVGIRMLHLAGGISKPQGAMQRTRLLCFGEHFGTVFGVGDVLRVPEYSKQQIKQLWKSPDLKNVWDEHGSE